MSPRIFGYIFSNVLALVYIGYNHGKPHPNHNIGASILGWCISLFFLYMGGVFTQQTHINYNQLSTQIKEFQQSQEMQLSELRFSDICK